MTTTQPDRDATKSELAVLRLLWSRGPSTIRELTDALYPGGTSSHYATVQKLLDRLFAKKFVSRKSRGRINVFSARVERDELIARRLRNTADQLADGSLTPLLTHLVSTSRLSSADIEALREMVGRFENQKKRFKLLGRCHKGKEIGEVFVSALNPIEECLDLHPEDDLVFGLEKPPGPAHTDHGGPFRLRIIKV